ncbi:transcriptional regulator AfsR [Amycolatopsis stemonae]
MAADAAMAFRVLGPVEVRRAGVPVPLPEGQVAQLLGVLLVNANRLVPVDTLMAVLWPDEAPATGRKMVQVRLSRLRALLAGTPAAIIGGRAGYRLDVRADAVDVAEFRARVSAARSAPPADALGLLGSALDLWREPPSGWFGETLAGQRIAASLEGERLAAVEAHVDAAVAAGRQQEAIDRAVDTLAAHPLRESLRARVMSALSTAGRQAEALAVFDEGRRLLADELGVDPGAELCAAHAAVLAGTPPEPPAPAVPRQLPAPLTRFVGREAEIAALTTIAHPAADEPATVVVHGPGGQGKSALVVRVAHRLAGEFPDGQLYADLLGGTAGAVPPTAADVLRRFLRALGLPLPAIPDDPAEAAAVYRSALAGRRVLVVLDNAVDSGQVRPLLPATPGAAALVTSRRLLATVEARHVALEPLPEENAVDLLARYSGRPVDDIRDGDKESVAAIARACDHQPLALRIAAARLASRPDWTPATLAARLADERHRLDELHFDDLAVRSSVELGYRDLDPPTARAFRLLGLLHLPWLGGPVVAALLGTDAAGADDALDRLVRATLLDVPEPGRYQLHDLVRLFAAEQAAREESPAAREAALRAAYEHYRARLAAVHARLRPHAYSALTDREEPSGEFADIAACVQWMDDETDNLIAAARSAADAPEFAPYALDITERLYSYLWKQDARADLLEVGRIATAAARHVGTDQATERATGIRAAAHRRVGRLDQAHAEFLAVVESRRRRGDLFGEGRGLTNVGIVLKELGRLDEAVACLADSIELVERHGPAGASRVALCCMAEVHLQAGRYAEASRYAGQSLARSRAHDDVTGAAYGLAVLGQAQYGLGDLAAAENALGECIAVCLQAHERSDEWEARLSRAQVRLRRGNPDGAAEDARRALEILGDHGDAYGRGAAHRQLARALHLLGSPAAGTHHHTAAALLGASATVPNATLETLLGRAP